MSLIYFLWHMFFIWSFLSCLNLSLSVSHSVFRSILCLAPQPRRFSASITTASTNPKPIKIHGTSRNQAGPAGKKLQKLMNMLNLHWPRALFSVPVCLSLLWSYCLQHAAFLLKLNAYQEVSANVLFLGFFLNMKLCRKFKIQLVLILLLNAAGALYM